MRFVFDSKVNDTENRRSITMRDDIKIGASFPDYELPDHADTPRKLSSSRATIRWCLR